MPTSSPAVSYDDNGVVVTPITTDGFGARDRYVDESPEAIHNKIVRSHVQNRELARARMGKK